MNKRVIKSAAEWLAKHPRWMVAFSLVYLISPFDLFPEALLGPLGYLDDILVLILPYFIVEYAKRLKNKRDVYDTTLED